MRPSQVGPPNVDPELHRPSKKANRRWAFILTILTASVAVAIIVVLVLVLTDTGSSTPLPKIVQEYQEKADKIIKYCTTGDQSGKAYDWVADIADRFGHRKIGSQALEDAIDHNLKQFQDEYGLSNVHAEEVLNLTNWIRAVEQANLTSPRQKTLAILGLGGTVGTNGVLTANATVVTSWDDLAKRCNLTDDRAVRGKIVVFNAPWDGSYGNASRYRGLGASAASECGAVAALIRSASSYSIYSPHTGEQYYSDNVVQIPAISLAPEDADLIQRIEERGEKPVVSLYITSHNNDTPVVSRNTIFDLPGSTYPKDFVMVSGHFDSWDVGAGAMDNGAGASVALRAIVNLKQMIDSGDLPRPKRSIRGILWTAEEPGDMGSQYFYQNHKNDSYPDNYVFLQEADEGFFRPLQLQLAASPAAQTMFQGQIFPLLRSLNVTIVPTDGLGDTNWWAQDGIPGTFLASAGQGYQRYFSYHHSEGDTPSVYGKKDLDVPTAVWAVLAYVIADMNETLPIGTKGTD